MESGAAGKLSSALGKPFIKPAAEHTTSCLIWLEFTLLFTLLVSSCSLLALGLAEDTAITSCLTFVFGKRVLVILSGFSVS